MLVIGCAPADAHICSATDRPMQTTFGAGAMQIQTASGRMRNKLLVPPRCESRAKLIYIPSSRSNQYMNASWTQTWRYRLGFSMHLHVFAARIWPFPAQLQTYATYTYICWSGVGCIHELRAPKCHNITFVFHFKGFTYYICKANYK